ncbi:MAG: aminomethyl-transferring glycine dehydrogenase subunit GcvPB [Thermotogae bacterium]|nr:aminomethyl-transferring glycine dehydrogenase subunit GcvPB [Thermotogota bacterium]
MSDKLLIEKTVPGREGCSLSEIDCPAPPLDMLFPSSLLREKSPSLPEMSESDVVRHFYNLAKKNYSIDEGMYPLGSCTMKYNPKVNEELSKLDGFTHIHPYQSIDSVQGALELIYELQHFLEEISGMDKITLQPAAGAHGEFTGVAIIRAYHEDRKDKKRTKMIVPDSAHGTNPASSAMNGFEVVEVKSDSDGLVDIEALKGLLGADVAGIMLTNPNTLGLFEKNIVRIAKLAHDAGALLYYDGANMNAILGYTRPGDMGFDIVHFNLHKTFSTPHGTGGPGSGPIGVKRDLIPFLPVPTVERSAEGKYFLNYDKPKSIGRVRSFYGNFIVLVKAYAYLLSVGKDNLKKISQMAVLNANYLMSLIKEHYRIPYDTICKHEFVATGKEYKKYGVKTLDIAKRLLDYGVHPPTIYFPLIVSEALMFEPTETESKESLEEYANILKRIAEEAKRKPELLKNAPSKTPVRRLNEVKAVRDMKLRW